MGTDFHAFEGKQPFFTYPRILVHELAVEIIELGPTDEDHDLKVGDRCCVQPYFNCGKCGACLRGYDNCCTRMQVFGVHRGGGMREMGVGPIGLGIALSAVQTGARVIVDQPIAAQLCQ